jgi:hypothetical protein
MRKPQPGLIVLYGNGKGLFGSDQYHQFFGPRHSSIDEIPIELSRVDRFLPILQVEVCFLRLPPGFPGGATISQPSNRYSRPLAEPDVVRYTIRLPV